jgi:hypothetical protein
LLTLLQQLLIGVMLLYTIGFTIEHWCIVVTVIGDVKYAINQHNDIVLIPCTIIQNNSRFGYTNHQQIHPSSKLNPKKAI